MKDFKDWNNNKNLINENKRPFFHERKIQGIATLNFVTSALNRVEPKPFVFK